jgi:NADPH:quinone reductase-like Zn-dependent oxidoreductase
VPSAFANPYRFPLTCSAHALCQESGAFTDHILAHGDIMMKIPPNMSDTDAATFGASLTVVGMAFYQVLNLRWPHNPYPRPIPIFINGGATASGAMAIQLAKL